jgi:signal transduction histidine kinase
MLKDSQFDGPIVDWLDAYALRGYMTTDTSLAIRGWNRWLEAKSGIRAQAILGQPLFEVFPDLVARQLDRCFKDALNGQVSVLAHRFHKYLLKFPASTEHKLSEMQQSAYISPLIRDGQVIGTMSVIDDVTERVIRENELLAAREQANKANAAKDRFIAVLSHDLRTPLTATLGWTHVLRDRIRDERVLRRGLEVIDRNASVQLELIEKLLDISRIDSAKLQLEIQPVEISEAIRATLETLEPVAQSKGVRIECGIMLDQRRRAALDPKRFQQIIWNLISNALKFTPKGGAVRVDVEDFIDGFQLSVADTGKGISAESMPHLFEPLWQADGGITQGGLGLGLAIVKNLVELHGGSIRAESAGLGQGAVFFVRMLWSGPAAKPLVKSAAQIAD